MLAAIMHLVQGDDVALVDQMLDDVTDVASWTLLDFLVLGHVIQQVCQSMPLQMPVHHFQAFGIKRPFFLARHVAVRCLVGGQLKQDEAIAAAVAIHALRQKPVLADAPPTGYGRALKEGDLGHGGIDVEVVAQIIKLLLASVKAPFGPLRFRSLGHGLPPNLQESRNLSGTGNIGHITYLVQSGLREPGRTGRASAGSSCRRTCAMPCRDSSSPVMSRNCGHDRLLLRKGRVGHTGMNHKVWAR